MDLFFGAAAFVVGVVHIVEATILVRQHGRLDGMLKYTGAIDFLWTLFCLYLLVTGRLESARWLAILSLVFSAVALVVMIAADPYFYKKEREELRVPNAIAYGGGLLGAVYAIAALVFLAT